MNRFFAMIVAAFASIFGATAALAQTTPMEDLQTDGVATVTSIGVVAAALAIAMLGIKAIPVAYKWVTAFLNR